MTRIAAMLLLLHCIVFNVRGQEIFINWSDRISVEANDAIYTDNGALCILCTLYCFDTINGKAVYCGQMGNTVIKVTSNNIIGWKKLCYNINHSVFDLAAKRIHYGSQLLVPFSYDLGMQDCKADQNGISIAQELALNACITMHPINGDTTNSSLFATSYDCGMNIIVFSTLDKDGNLKLVYRNDSSQIGYGKQFYHMQTITSQMTLQTDEPFLPSELRNHFLMTLQYDSVEHEFLIADSAALYTFRNASSTIKKISFKSICGEAVPSKVKIAIGKNFYAVNITVDSISKSKSYIATFLKSGELISRDTTIFFDDIIVSEYQSILAVASHATAYPYDLFNLSASSLTLKEFTPSLKLIRQSSFGEPGIIATRLLANDGEVSVVGTILLSRGNVPAPNQIYVYKTKLDEIPTSEGVKLNCNDIINVTPNPASNFIRLTSSYGNYDVDIYNEFGQHMKYFQSNQNTSQISTSAFPTGMYILKTTSKDLTCINKFLKTN